MHEALLEKTGVGYSDHGAAGSVTLESARALDDIKTGRDRRVHLRHRQDELHWIRLARLQFGQGVLLVDLSTGGARLDSPVALGPNSVSALEIVGAGLETVVSFRVLRCEVGGLTAGGVIYRGACEFIRPLELPGLARPVPQAAPPEDVLELDVALKNLVTRLGVPGDFERLSPVQVLLALKSLHVRAANMYSDPMGQRLNALLKLVVPALEHRSGLSAVIEGMERQLRRVVPNACVRLAGAANAATESGVNAFLIGIPGLAAAGPLVSIDVPKGVTLTAWQSRVLRTTSRLFALLQRLEPNGPVNVVIPERPQPAVPSPAVQKMVQPTVSKTDEPTVQKPAAPTVQTIAETTARRVAEATASPEPRAQQIDGVTGTTGWQKVVVRYIEGQSLKGYAQDFHASRPHFTLWSSASLTEGDAVIVPLVRLKAVFFVRDFAGNPRHVERSDIVEPQRGRRIEVTLNDEEVIVGTTLNYRSDGQGFFVTPIDPLANNIRVFVVANSVRQVRFPAVR